MFNVKHLVAVLLEWLKEPLGDDASATLDEFAAWLVREALPAGGIGPHEAQRVTERHIADSISFAKWLDPAASVVLDVGSGVGLPGIPLAILRPRSRFVLLDRSRGRTDLAARAVRILRLGNAEVVTDDVASHRATYDAVVMRAAVGPADLLQNLGGLLMRSGSAVIALSRSSPPDALRLSEIASGSEFKLEIVEVPVLDSPSWLLRITHRDIVV